MAQLLIIADDFTGALDTAVQFAAYGEDIRVLTGPDADLTVARDCRVLVVDAETRHLPPQGAYPYLGLIPGICICLTVMAVNFIGDGLRDAFDPRTKN